MAHCRSGRWPTFRSSCWSCSACFWAWNKGGQEFPTAFFVIFPIHFLTILMVLGLQVFYIIHAIQNQPDQNSKILWILLLLLFNLMVIPVYFYKYIWSEEIQDQN